jgi:hypothetical protein
MGRSSRRSAIAESKPTLGLNPKQSQDGSAAFVPAYIPGIQILPAGINSVPSGMGSGSSDLQ